LRPRAGTRAMEPRRPRLPARSTVTRVHCQVAV
jgi:hypothetical protein